jgi:hypothetical protein
MEFKHACSFCGWGQLSASPVMLTPSCARCGCALDARPSVRPGAGAEAADLGLLPVRWMRALRWLGASVALLALYAATKAGYDAAGGSGALIAFGMGCFLLVPFVPQRLGAPSGAAGRAAAREP